MLKNGLFLHSNWDYAYHYHIIIINSRLYYCNSLELVVCIKLERVGLPPLLIHYQSLCKLDYTPG